MMGFGFDAMDGMMSVFPIFFFIVFALVIGAILVGLIRQAGEWHRNNQSPRLTVPVAVVSKRTEVSSSASTAGQHMHTSSTTSYYVTFEVRSSDRMELEVSGKEYGMIAEGDIGILTFQGTRFLSFERR